MLVLIYLPFMRDSLDIENVVNKLQKDRQCSYNVALWRIRPMFVPPLLS
jgi:hypothetical protein